MHATAWPSRPSVAPLSELSSSAWAETRQARCPGGVRSVPAVRSIARARAAPPVSVQHTTRKVLVDVKRTLGSVQRLRPMSTGACFSISNMVPAAHVDSRLKHLPSGGPLLNHRGTQPRRCPTRIGPAWRGRRERADGCGIDHGARCGQPRPSGAAPRPPHVDFHSPPDGRRQLISPRCRCRGAASRRSTDDRANHHYVRDRPPGYHFDH